jgi:hypothetical protein
LADISTQFLEGHPMPLALGTSDPSMLSKSDLLLSVIL